MVCRHWPDEFPRWYDSETGRWLSKDPIGLSGGMNLYAFCGNNPVCRIDVYGTLSWEEAMAYASGFVDGFVEAVKDGELKKGLAATVDGMIPFAFPFEEVYSDECGNYDGVYDVSRICGAVSTTCLITATGIKVESFLNAGREIAIGKDFRFAPNGNRTGNRYGERPHYHRRGIDSQGMTKPGQSINRHRPWETKRTDKSFWDRF